MKRARACRAGKGNYMTGHIGCFRAATAATSVILLLTGCGTAGTGTAAGTQASAETASSEADPYASVPDSSAAADSAAQTAADSATPQKNAYGAVGEEVWRILEDVSNGSQFYVYAENGSGENPQISDALTFAAEKGNADFGAPVYTFDFKTLSESEQNAVLKIFVPGTVYAVKDGKVISSFVPEDTSSDAGSSASLTEAQKTGGYRSQFLTWVYNCGISENSHGLSYITYDQILQYQKEGKKFAVYVGRESCRDCRAFTPVLEQAVKDVPTSDVPVYYFYTQSYKSAILAGTDGAQEKWDSVKKTLGIDGTPSFIVYGGKKPVYFGKWGSTDIFESGTDAERGADQKKVLGDFETFMEENGLSSEDCSGGCR